MNNLDIPLALSKGKIVCLDAAGVEVAPGSPNAVTVRTEGFALLRNGAFKIVATFHHPNPPPVSKRRCKTKGGKLPAANPPRPASSDDDEVVAIRDAERIEPGLDPPENPASGFTLLDLKNEPGDLPEIAAHKGKQRHAIDDVKPQGAVLQARARHRPLLYAVRLSARRGDRPHGQTRPFRLTARDIEALAAHAAQLEARR